MRITYYLFKNTVKSFDDVWKEGADAPKGDYIALALKDNVPFEAEAYLLANKPSDPEWWKYVSPHFETASVPKIKNHSSSLILLLKSKGRIFAVTFGHGFTAIERSALESDFGLKVTLNSVNPKKLRSIQARNIDPTTVQKQLVVNQDSALSVFDVDFYQDLLAKMEGVPEDKNFGTRVAGAEACYLISDVEFTKLGDKCADLLEKYKKKEYQKNFKFVDQVRPVRDDALIVMLDAELAAAMKIGNAPGLAFALPDIGAYDLIHKYRVHLGRWNQTFDDLNAAEILEAYNKDHPGANNHAEISVRTLKDDDHPLHSFSLRDCAVYQVKHKGKIYVFTLNQWYIVNETYAAAVDQQIAEISVISKRSFLPSIGPKETEGDYNDRAAKSHGFAFMDKKNIKPLGASSAIEVCDLFSTGGEFVHVKRHTRSATLSHLLAQGSVSARLFVDDAGYRKSFRGRLPKGMQGLVDLAKVDFGKFSVVYAISAPPARSLPGDLPFFTKVNLLFHCRSVSRMGMKPKVYHIHEV